MAKGKIYLLITAVIYGIIPVFAKQVTISGGDGVTLVFLRSALCLPLLFFYLIISKTRLRLTRKELFDTLILTLFGNTPAMVCLYASFGRGAVGSASMLHFVYPFLIVLAGAILFKQRLSKKKIVGVLLASVGVLLSFDAKTDWISATLAILSGVFYAFFVIYLDRSGADKINYWVLTFYLSLGMVIASLFMAYFGNGINLPTDRDGIISAILVSALTTLVAIPLFQRGVEKEGAAEAGLLSMAEPVTSILLGIWLLGEKLTFPALIGAILMSFAITFG